MSEQGFTEGPWMISGGLSIKCCAGDSRRHIAKVGARHLDDDVDRANAYLIAAAPEMYDEMRNIADDLRDWLDGMDEKPARLVGYLAHLDYALAKAEGRDE